MRIWVVRRQRTDPKQGVAFETTFRGIFHEKLFVDVRFVV